MSAGKGSGDFRPEPPAPIVSAAELVALYVYLHRECVVRELVDPSVEVSLDDVGDVVCCVASWTKGSRLPLATAVVPRHLVPHPELVAAEVLRQYNEGDSDEHKDR